MAFVVASIVKVADVPPMDKYAPLPCVKVPVPASAELTRKPTPVVILFVMVPLIVKVGIVVALAPLMVFEAPLKI